MQTGDGGNGGSSTDPSRIPWWVWAIVIAAGVILLILIIVLIAKGRKSYQHHPLEPPHPNNIRGEPVDVNRYDPNVNVERALLAERTEL